MSQGSSWCPEFAINEIKRHSKGYTIYKITSKIYCQNNVESASEVSVWRRYSELRSLHKAVALIVKENDITESIPLFSKASVLHRFRPSVIESRRAAAINLLYFCGRHPAIFRSEIFISFFQDVCFPPKRPLTSSHKNFDINSSFKEQLCLGMTQSLYADLSSDDDSNNSVNNGPDKSDIFDSSADSLNDYGNQDIFCHENEMTHSCSGAGVDDVQCDCLPSSGLSALPSLQEHFTVHPSAPRTSTSSDPVNDDTLSTGKLERSCSSYQELLSPFLSFAEGFLWDSSASNCSVGDEFSVINTVHTAGSVGTVSVSNEDNLNGTSAHGHTESMARISSAPSYMTIAEHQLGQAELLENNKEYSKALLKYEEGVQTLVKGAKDEPDHSRRELVKRKTSYYLLQAEKLISKLTRKERPEPETLTDVTPEAVLKLKYRRADLTNYKVVGCVGATLLIARNILTRETVVIKVLIKSSADSRAKTIMPQNIPFMVPIIGYFETEYAIYLILKYISGGQLWNHIREYVTPFGLEKSLDMLPCHCCCSRCLPPITPFDEEDISVTTSSCLSSNLNHPCLQSYSTYSNFHLPSCNYAVRNSFMSLADGCHQRSGAPQSLNCTNNTDCCLKTKAGVIPKSFSVDFIPRKQLVNNFSVKDSPGEGKYLDEACSIGSDTLSGLSDEFSCSFDDTSEQFEYAEATEKSHKKTQEKTADFSADDLLVSKAILNDMALLKTGSEFEFNICNCTDKNSSDKTAQLLDCVGSLDGYNSDAKTLQKEDSKRDLLNTDDLIKTSKQLLQNVNKTLSICRNKNASVSENLEELSGSITGNITLMVSSEELADNELKFEVPESSGQISDNKHIGQSEVLVMDNLLSTDESEVVNELDNVNVSSTPIKNIVLTQNCKLTSLLELYSQKVGQCNCHKLLPVNLIRIWISQIILAMDALHKAGIIWGDFSPRNILLDDGGSIILSYQCQWSSVGVKSFVWSGDHPDCSWNGYLAPELESPLTTPTVASDWWSLGALLYHLLVGQPVTNAHLGQMTSHSELFLPGHLSPEAASLLSNLLCVHPNERLGSNVAGVQEIKDHPFFYGILWDNS